jgi:hypothetical protein
MVFYQSASPITAILNVNKQFERFSTPGVALLLPKLIFCFFQLVIFGVCMWKLNSLKLTPWSAPPGQGTIPEFLEYSSGNLL